jgi:hypothetical protein
MQIFIIDTLNPGRGHQGLSGDFQEAKKSSSSLGMFVARILMVIDNPVLSRASCEESFLGSGVYLGHSCSQRRCVVFGHR